MQMPPAAVQVTENPGFCDTCCVLVVITAHRVVIPPAAADALPAAQLLQQSLARLDRARGFKQPQGSLCAARQGSSFTRRAMVPGFFRPMVSLYANAMYDCWPQPALQALYQSAAIVGITLHFLKKATADLCCPGKAMHLQCDLCYRASSLRSFKC